MRTCKECGVPLDGPLSIIPKLLGVHESDKVPGVCNKCEGKYLKKGKKTVIKEKTVAKKRVKTKKKAKKKTTKTRTKRTRKGTRSKRK